MPTSLQEQELEDFA